MKSDEEIMEERRRSQKFDSADNVLSMASWALWAIAIVWFFSFSVAAPEISAPHAIANPSLSMIIAGFFCSALSKASPKGTWSTWRSLWQLLFAGAFGVMAATFVLLQLRGSATWSQQQSMATVGMIALCGGVSAGAVLTCPGTNSKPARWSSSYFGRLTLVIDGGLGLFLCFQVFVQAASLLGDALGLATLAVSILPLGIISLGMVFVGTDSELVGALPSAVMVHMLGFLIHFFTEGRTMAYASAAAALLHLALYLPFPASDPLSNPFHVSMKKDLMSFYKLITEPVSGWGEENES